MSYTFGVNGKTSTCQCRLACEVTMRRWEELIVWINFGPTMASGDQGDGGGSTFSGASRTSV